MTLCPFFGGSFKQAYLKVLEGDAALANTVPVAGGVAPNRPGREAIYDCLVSAEIAIHNRLEATNKIALPAGAGSTILSRILSYAYGFSVGIGANRLRGLNGVAIPLALEMEMLSSGAPSKHCRASKEELDGLFELANTANEKVLPLPCPYGIHRVGINEPSKSRRPVLAFYQDESCYNHGIFGSHFWSADELQKLRRKSLGIGVMVSGFCSAETGIGLNMSTDDLERINEKRKSENLEPLTADPAILLFEYGSNRGGYFGGVEVAMQVC